MPEENEEHETLEPSLLPIYRSDVRDIVDATGIRRLRDEGREELERGTPSYPNSAAIRSGLLRRCYGSVRKLVSSRIRLLEPGVEAAVTTGFGRIGRTVLQPATLMRKLSRRIRSKDKTSPVHAVGDNGNAVDTDHRLPACRDLPTLCERSHSSPHLLSDDENGRMNRRIDRLVEAITDRRPIHFEPRAPTGEVEIFADHQNEVIDRENGEEDELEQSIAESPGNFSRVIRTGNGVRQMKSVHSPHYATSTDSWATTASEKSSSNAWERAVAAANVRFALECGELDHMTTVLRRSLGSLGREITAPRGWRSDRTISPIPLDFYKPLRMSTPSIHSNGSEQDTSSPLFGKSCERILDETYAEPPKSTFERESPEHSQLDEWAFVSEPRDLPSSEAREVEAPTNSRRIFGVFHDRSKDQPSARKNGHSALRSRVLKDVSNLRRPEYLNFDSFAKHAETEDDQADNTVPAVATSTGFGGAVNSKSRMAYINRKWPRLLGDRSNGTTKAEPPKPDGAARRRNEQAIGSPIDESLYSLSHAKSSAEDSILSENPFRQAHFDLALARLEGRALPPPRSPIPRYPDWAALYDRDVYIEGSHRPLPLRSPAPSKLVNQMPRWGLRR